ncbi:MAG: hypothetical protein M1826_007090 [Phylliscum demangeonii]|nr:MAG: hypothetical protein M1826_007090 [Phylliscum demangeonii]
MSLHSLKRITDPECAFLPDHNPFNILGLNPRETDFPDDQALRAAYDRAAAHARSLATSSTLSLPSLLQVELAYSWLISDFRAPALAFWRSLHRSTWNPHAHVGSVEAGLPIPGQSGPSHDEAETLMWAAVDAMTAKPYDDGFALQSSYMDGLADGSEGGSDGDDGSLFCVVLGTFRCSTEKDERANVVVGMLDRRGRYYRRILDFWMKDEPLPERKWNDRSPGWGSSFAFSCPHGSIDYLTRFRNRTELEVMALVRQELAWLQADAPSDAGGYVAVGDKLGGLEIGLAMAR